MGGGTHVRTVPLYLTLWDHLDTGVREGAVHGANYVVLKFLCLFTPSCTISQNFISRLYSKLELDLLLILLLRLTIKGYLKDPPSFLSRIQNSQVILLELVIPVHDRKVR